MIAVGWLAQSAAHLPSGNAWMSPDEQAVWEGLRFPRRRAEWRLGRWTAKQALVACMDAGADLFPSITIRAAADGAPEAMIDDMPMPYALSISHRDGVAFCAVAAEDVALGCDLEKIEPRSEAFVVDYFTPEERALVHEAEEDDRSVLANLIWSAKESALKALREGLRLDTRSVVVQLRYRNRAHWQPLRVVYAGHRRVFEGWYRVDETYVWTLAAHPAPGRPAPLHP